MLNIRISQIGFILAFGYWLYQFSSTNPDAFGMQFRFLTHWGLSLAMVMHFLNWRARKNGQPDQRYALMAMVAVLNLLVVFLYWRLYFIDPALVNGDKTPLWHQEYYLHLIGPAIIVIDAIWLYRAFRFFWRGAIATTLLCMIYVLWIEGLVKPMNSEPVGAISSGLPYPFLNDMMTAERINFYAVTTATALGFYLICWIISIISCWITRHQFKAHQN
jgi:hypothetical protein